MMVQESLMNLAKDPLVHESELEKQAKGYKRMIKHYITTVGKLQKENATLQETNHKLRTNDVKLSASREPYYRKRYKILKKELNALRKQNRQLSRRLKKNSIANVEPLTKKLKNEVYERDGNKCCKCSSTNNLSIDHIVPRVIGGTNHISNLQLLCKTCNLNKGLDIMDYR